MIPLYVRAGASMVSNQRRPCDFASGRLEFERRVWMNQRMTRRPELRLRAATPDDVPRLVELNHEAYPDLVEEGVVWEAHQLHAHLERFPEGQRVVTNANGVVLGAISTLVPRGIDPLAQHTWLEITDRGRFTTHEAGGDTLYLADIYVSPAAWGKGAGQALYAELFALGARMGATRVVAGGRLWGYFEYADSLSPQRYVDKVLAGDIRDRVLGSQLRAGFRVAGILSNYLQDKRSGNFATLLVHDLPR